MMTSPTAFHYYISNITHPLTEKSSHWTIALPQNRRNQINSNEVNRVTYGDYFSAITSYLTQHNYNSLHLALHGLYQYDPEYKCPDQVRIFLIKHGEYYHPAKIETLFGEKIFSFVMNAAVSAAGLSLIAKEYGILRRLQNSFPYPFIPRVFDFGEKATHGGLPIKMFIGEWFDGFYEFHLTREQENDKMGVVVWNDDGQSFLLNKEQIVALFENAARILTAYYNPFSFEHISSWHHAAGDFVVKIEKNFMAVKLITVRNYGPMINEPNADMRTVLEGLLIFLLNLSIRIRLDRIDGVGEYAWANEWALKGVVRGFFNGLSDQKNLQRIPTELIFGFKKYLSSFNKEHFMEWATNLIDNFNPDTPGLDLIKLNLPNHIKYLHALIRDFLCSG